ncbi:MAG TPA: alpha/beta fold hydrolase [Gemmatimonadaceae bacterium]
MELKYEEAGKGYPVILLHGFPHNRSLWADQLFGLSDRCRVIAPDLRGFGESPTAPPWSMEGFADDVAELMERLDIEKAVIGGLSMGGYVVFEFLRRYGDRVHSIILADTRSGADSDETRAKRRDLQALAHAAGPVAVADAQITGMIGATSRETRPDVVQRVHAMLAATSIEGIVGGLEAMMNRRDSTRMLPEITVPVLIVVGEEDALTPVKESRAMHAAIPGSTLAVIPKAGHVSNIENSAAFNSAMRNFLASVGH